MNKQFTKLGEAGEEEQETEITFIHTLPPEVLEKLRKRQQGGRDEL